MIETMTVVLSEDQGQFYAAGKNPGFLMVGSTRQAAIDKAIQAWDTHLRFNRKPPRGRISATSAPFVAESTTRKPNRFGGLPVKKLTPKEVLTLTVEV